MLSSLSNEVVLRILNFCWQDVWDLAPELLVCKSWCHNFILPAVPRMISFTEPNLDRIGLRINEESEERLIQAHPDDLFLMDMDVYRQVVRFQLYAHRLLSSSMQRELDLLVEFLLRTIHESFVRWRPLVYREIFEEESLGEMKKPGEGDQFVTSSIFGV